MALVDHVVHALGKYDAIPHALQVINDIFEFREVGDEPILKIRSRGKDVLHRNGVFPADARRGCHSPASILCTPHGKTFDMESKSSRISIIVALGCHTRAIGSQGDLIWKNLKEDMQRFKRLTTGHPVVMGHNTWVSLPEAYRPLPGRTNIVITAEPSIRKPGMVVAANLEEALVEARRAPGNEEIFIIGGGRVYADALHLADRLYVTEVDDDTPGDVFFPDYTEIFTEEIEREEHREHDPPFTFRTLVRH